MKQIQKIAGVLMLASLSFSAFSAEEQSKEKGAMQPGMKMQEGMEMQPGMGMQRGKGMQGGGMGMQGGKGMNKGMMGGMGGMSDEQKEQHMRAMQEHMLMMHELSNKIIAEKDPKKKQELKDQQLEMMKAHRAQMMKHMQQMREQ